METITKTNIGTGAAIVIALTAIVLQFGLIGQENVYVCLDNEIAMKCDKLSAVNPEGFQTRCYYFSEELNRSTYKMGKIGWLPYEPTKEVKFNLSEVEKIYLVCEKTNELINECQIINQNESIFKISNT